MLNSATGSVVQPARHWLDLFTPFCAKERTRLRFAIVFHYIMSIRYFLWQLYYKPIINTLENRNSRGTLV